MNVLTTLSSGTEYTKPQLQLILAAWVMSTVLERTQKISTQNGDVSEDDYDKRSVYALLYSLYQAMGEVKSETGEPYRLTFNTWGYTWPTGWGDAPTTASDPERFGKNAYTGLFGFDAVREYIEQREGQVHLVEMGCGTGAGAHHICKNVFPKCTYEAVDMQEAAIRTCRRLFVPALDDRLVATRADCTKLPVASESADIVVVCETHVTEHGGQASDEDREFFRTAHRILKKGGFLVWGNAIPDSTWKPCFDFLNSIDMKVREVRDVTEQAIHARDQDEARVVTYVDQCLDRFHGFRIPFFGRRKRREAELALQNFYRNPGTNLYENMKNGTDTYKVVLAQKTSGEALA
jgi:SAM-dependent methyltransferase